MSGGNCKRGAVSDCQPARTLLDPLSMMIAVSEVL